MVLDGLKLEFVGYPNHTGGRVWIGNVQAADVFQRGGEPDLFNADPITYEFHLSRGFVKHQKENEWLELIPLNERQKTFNTIEEGLEWIKTKLYGK